MCVFVLGPRYHVIFFVLLCLRLLCMLQGYRHACLSFGNRNDLRFLRQFLRLEKNALSDYKLTHYYSVVHFILRHVTLSCISLNCSFISTNSSSILPMFSIYFRTYERRLSVCFFLPKFLIELSSFHDLKFVNWSFRKCIQIPYLFLRQKFF
jgi:hypothetical protein